MEFKSEKQIFEEREEKENYVDNELMLKKSETQGESLRISKPKNQIKKVMKRLTFEELKDKARTDEHDIAKKGTVKFYIGTKDKVRGQISFLEEEHKQKFILERIVKLDNGMDIGYRTIYFNEPITQRERNKVWDTIEGEFYLYKLQTPEQNYKLLSTKKLDLGEYDIWGTIIEILDDIDMGNYSRMTTKLPLLFVHSAFTKEHQIQSHEEFIERFKKYNLTENKFFNWVYTAPNGWVYEFPKSFCYIQLANLLACADEFNTFHLPLLMISETGTGKTTGTELIFNRMNEIQGFTDMTSSTLKGLIPSFRNPKDIQAGLFLESMRYVPIDEFFAGVSNLHPEEKDKVMENIKNLLDYKEREHKSGNGKIKGRMKAEHIALTNPKGYANTILQLSNHFPPENITRYLIWYIPKEQKEFIEMKVGNLQKGEYNFIAKEDFLDGIDYLKTFNCAYDIEKVREIYKIGEHFLKSRDTRFKNLIAMYTSRYFIHACRLTDSIIKLRCWTTGDKRFRALAQDYELVRKLWLEMLENWGIDFFQTESKSA